jgi:hypothetical protein
VGEALGRHDDALVHHLHGGGHDATGDDGRDRCRAILHRAEIKEHGSHRGGAGREPDTGTDDDPQRPLGSDEDPSEIVAGGLGSLGAEPLDGAVREDHVHREHVARGDAVCEAVRAPGVGVDVAPDGARLLRRRVRGIGEPERRECVGQVQVQDAGLHPRQTILGPDFDDLVHLRRHHDEGVADRRGPSRQAGAGAARHDRQGVPRGHPHASHDVLDRVRESDEGAPALDHRSVTGIEGQGERIGQDLGRSEGFLQLEAGRIDIGHGDPDRLARQERRCGSAVRRPCRVAPRG